MLKSELQTKTLNEILNIDKREDSEVSFYYCGSS